MKRKSMFPDEKTVERVRREYPVGTRVRLIEMPEEPYPLPKGALGTVIGVDDTAALLMKWDCGRSISVIFGVDRVEKI